MSKKINVKNMSIEALGEIKDRVDNIEGAAEYNLKQIPLNEIEVNEKNSFGMREIDELAESMKQYGQLHNAVVKKIDDNKYKLISGERRYRAATKLGWKTLACKVVNCKDEVEEEILLITANLQTRELNDMERSQNAIRLTELIEAQRKQGQDFQGKKTREVVAEKMNVAPATVQKLKGLQKLIPELQQMVSDEKIPLETANQYAQMSEESQQLVYETLQAGININAKEAKEIKDRLSKEQEHTMQEMIEKANKEKEVYQKQQEKIEQEKKQVLKEKEEMEVKLQKLEEKIKNTNDDSEKKKLKEDLKAANKKITEKEDEMNRKIQDIEREYQNKLKENLTKNDSVNSNAEIMALAQVVKRTLVSLLAKTNKAKLDMKSKEELKVITDMAENLKEYL